LYEWIMQLKSDWLKANKLQLKLKHNQFQIKSTVYYAVIVRWKLLS